MSRGLTQVSRGLTQVSRGLTQGTAPTDGVSLLGLAGSPGSWTDTAGGERLRNCRYQVRTPPTYRCKEKFISIISVLLHSFLLG